MGTEITKRLGPKTERGRLAVRLNARKHGIISPQPVVTDFETEEDWETHRQSIMGSLAPQDGLEQALAERVALMSWRLNRVVVFETENIAQLRESVVEDVTSLRRWDSSVDVVDQNPQNPIDALAIAEETHEVVKKFRNPQERPAANTPISGADAETLLYAAADALHTCEFLKMQAHGGDAGNSEDRIEELLDNLPGIPADTALDLPDYTAGQLMELIGWMAQQEKTFDIDPPNEDETPAECLLERMHTKARYAMLRAVPPADKASKQLTQTQRNRILPNESVLQKIGRYEAHLSREMYKALHELEALQTRRTSGAAPLARIDVQGMPEN
jgi:hypothetical protein